MSCYRCQIESSNFFIVIWWYGLEVSLVLRHVLLHLEVEVGHEGLVLPVDDVVGHHEAQHSGSEDGKANNQQVEPVSLQISSTNTIFFS